MNYAKMCRSHTQKVGGCSFAGCWLGTNTTGSVTAVGRRGRVLPHQQQTSAANVSWNCSLTEGGQTWCTSQIECWIYSSSPTSDPAPGSAQAEPSTVPSGLLSLLLSSYLFNWKKLIEWKWSTKLVLILLMELSSWPCLEEDVKLDFRKGTLMLALNLMG